MLLKLLKARELARAPLLLLAVLVSPSLIAASWAIKRGERPSFQKRAPLSTMAPDASQQGGEPAALPLAEKRTSGSPICQIQKEEVCSQGGQPLVTIRSLPKTQHRDEVDWVLDLPSISLSRALFRPCKPRQHWKHRLGWHL